MNDIEISHAYTYTNNGIRLEHIINLNALRGLFDYNEIFITNWILSLSLTLSFSLFLYPAICLTVYLSVTLRLCLSEWLSACLLFSLSLPFFHTLSFTFLFCLIYIYPSIHSFIHSLMSHKFLSASYFYTNFLAFVLFLSLFLLNKIQKLIKPKE